jgi:hypothetical protein
MTEMLSPGEGRMTTARRPPSAARRRRRRDFRTLATWGAMVVAVAWTMLVGVGIVLR